MSKFWLDFLCQHILKGICFGQVAAGGCVCGEGVEWDEMAPGCLTAASLTMGKTALAQGNNTMKKKLLPYRKGQPRGHRPSTQTSHYSNSPVCAQGPAAARPSPRAPEVVPGLTLLPCLAPTALLPNMLLGGESVVLVTPSRGKRQKHLIREGVMVLN